VLVGDGSYLMMKSEIATSVMLDMKLNIIVLDNDGSAASTRCSAVAAAPRSTISSSMARRRLRRPCREPRGHLAQGGEPRE
jgi:3D-(3,5/4)-trihydroxycyclohexane-1,2-dione acylhydrolase (decyclizing)